MHVCAALAARLHRYTVLRNHFLGVLVCMDSVLSIFIQPSRLAWLVRCTHTLLT